jgi:hypothetical protein
MKLRIIWKAWGTIVMKFLALAGSLASLVGLLLQFLPSPKDLSWWAIFLLAFASFCLFLFLALEILTYQRRRVFDKGDKEGIKKYMHSWIQHGGRVAVWTRDMSWARNAETRGLLREKSADGELILCMPEEDDFAKELAAEGAEICAYGKNHLESPASRFTISCFGRDGARVAVGRAEGEAHVIDEFNSGGHPAFYLAEDLVTLVRAQCTKRRNV